MKRTAWLSVICCAAVCSGQAAAAVAIRVPSARDPAVVKADAQRPVEFAVHVVLPVHLTPPPGVQQPRAWRGWKVYVERRARDRWKNRGAAGVLRYACRIVRVRPGAVSSECRVLVRLPAWVPPGRYDVEMALPGGAARARAALVVGGTGARRSGIVAVWKAGAYVVENAGPAATVRVEWVLPGLSRPLRLRTRGGDARIAAVAPARYDGWAWAHRWVSVAVAVPAGNPRQPGIAVLFPRLRAARRAPGVIDGPRGPLYFLRRYAFGVRGARGTRGVAWRFSDGETAAGPWVRHRWVSGRAAQVDAVWFDAQAVGHTARWRRALGVGGISSTGRLDARWALAAGAALFLLCFGVGLWNNLVPRMRWWGRRTAAK